MPLASNNLFTVPHTLEYIMGPFCEVPLCELNNHFTKLQTGSLVLQIISSWDLATRDRR